MTPDHHLPQLRADPTERLALGKTSQGPAERKRPEAELRQSRKLRSLGALVAGMTHELNTPVQYIQDNVGFIEEAFESLLSVIDCARTRLETSGNPVARSAFDADCERLDLPYLRAELPEALASLRLGAARMAKVVVAMRSFSHPHHADMAYHDLNQGLRDALTIARGEYEPVADLELDLGDIPRVKCWADDLNTVFLNLIVNAAHAIRAADRGRGQIRVTSGTSGDHVVVTISDNGTGIPNSIRDRVFDPFFTTKPAGQGTGQGLSMAHNIVAAHRGRIRFETATDEGTAFIIEVPICPPLSEEA